MFYYYYYYYNNYETLITLCLLITSVVFSYVFLIRYKQDELTEKTSILAARKDELDASSKRWKNRVEKSDLENYSVAGRMQQHAKDIQIALPNVSNDAKKLPRVKRYKGKDDDEGLSIF